MNVKPMVLFNGQCEEAFKRYEKQLGGRITMMTYFEGTPAADQTPPGWRRKVLHARLKIGEGFLLGSDAPPGHYAAPQGFFVSLSVATASEAERLFATLCESGRVQSAMQETFFATRFGMTIDRFGVPWVVVCERPESR